MKRNPKPKHWSYSALSTFEQCPKRWHYQKIERLPDPGGPHLERGKLVHEMLERATLAKRMVSKNLPSGWVAEVVKRYRKMPALRTEQKLFLDRAWENLPPDPDRFMPSRTWLMAVLDILAAGFFADWKTGKVYTDKHEDQMHLYATALASITGVLHWVGELVYVDQECVEELEFDFREDGALEEAQNYWNERAARLQSEKKFPKRPTKLCGWCPYHKSKGGPCSGQD